MASLHISATGSGVLPPQRAVSNNSRYLIDGSIFGNAIFAKKHTKRDLTITNVASKLPAVVPPPEREVASSGKLVAWTSIRQERWEGELDVEGKIPLWLVSNSFF